MAADYSLILRIINASDDPADALAAFVAQEREDAAHKARPTITHPERLTRYPDLLADDDMCDNCVTPWKCNGPHLS